MRKIWLVLFSLVLVFTGYYFVSHYLFYSVSLKRGLTPAIKLPGKDIKQYLPQSQIFTGPISVGNKLKMDVFADLDGNLPRVLEFDQAGHLLASITNRGKVVALPDDNGDGKADKIIDVISGLIKPHGIAFDKDYLYIAESDSVSRYFYDASSMKAGGKELLFSLPGGGEHFTRTIVIHNGKLYTSVGSSCNVCVETDWRRAGILVSDLDGKDLRIYAKGLRNTVFFAFDDQGRMWGADMGRDYLGDNLPPDEINIIEDGKDYGWPYCYGDRIRDSEFMPSKEVSFCPETTPSFYNLPAHVAPLGIAFVKSNLFDNSHQGDLLLSEHGSWNRSSKVGYQVKQFSFFADLLGEETNLVSGFLREGDVLGRPVDLKFDKAGRLFISDDYAGLIYLLTR